MVPSDLSAQRWIPF